MIWKRIRAAWELLVLPWSPELQRHMQYEKVPEGTLTRCLLAEAENERLTETNLVLEDELAEARRENRAILNLQLQAAGLRTLPEIAPTEKPKPIQRVRRLSLHQQQRLSAFKTGQQAAERAKQGGGVQ
jgi:hypothetical protein